MTHLGNAIARLMLNRPKLMAKDVAVKAGVDPSYISKLRAGTMKHLHSTLVARIADVLGRTPTERAEIIAAHMKDEGGDYVPDLVQVSVGGKLPNHNLHPDIEYLQKHLSDPRIRDAVRSLADLHKNSASGKQSGKPKKQ